MPKDPMKNRLGTLATLLFCFSILPHCGTEIGNPSVNSDLSGSLGYVVNDYQASASSSRLAVRKQGTQGATESGTVLLYKITADGTLSPAVSVKDSSTTPPDIVRVKRIDDRLYILFAGQIAIGGQSCTLVELTPPNGSRCIDSIDLPANPIYADAFSTNDADSRQLFVTTSPSGDIYYASKTKNLLENPLSSKLAVVTPNNVRSQVTANENHVFHDFFQKSDGTLFALKYQMIDSFDPQVFHTLYPYCRLESGTCTPMIDPAFGSKELNYFLLNNDRILYSASLSSDVMHLRIGNVGDVVNPTNFATDLKPLVPAPDLPSTVTFHRVFEASNGNIYAASGPSIVQIYPVFQTVNASTDFGYVDYRAGQKFIFNAPGNGPTPVKSLDPTNNQVATLNFPNETVAFLRYVSDDVVLFSTATDVPGNPNKRNINLYKYSVTANTYEKLLQMDKSLFNGVIHVN